MENDPLVQQIYNEIKGTIRNKTIDSSSIILLVTLTIPVVQRVARGKDGAYKKKVLLTVINQLVNDSNLDQTSKFALLTIVETIVPDVVDTLIDVAKNRLDIGKGTTNGGCCTIS